MNLQNRDFSMRKYILNYSFKSSKVGENRDFWNCMNLFLTTFFYLFKNYLHFSKGNHFNLLLFLF